MSKCWVFIKKKVLYIDWILCFLMLLLSTALEFYCKCGMKIYVQQPIIFTSFLLFVSAPVLFLPQQLNRIYTVTVIPIICIFCYLSFYLRHFYSIQIDETLIGIIITSSFREAKGFFSAQLLSKSAIITYIFLFLLIGVICTSYSIKQKTTSKMRSFGFMLIFPFALVIFNFCIFRSPNAGELQQCTMSAYLRHLIKSYYNNLSEYIKIANSPELPDNIKSKFSSDFLGVIVIGESATRNHHSIYGYHRNTTPNLQKNKDNLFIFNNVITSRLLTNEAYKMLFTFATLHDSQPKSSLSSVIKETGYKSVYLSRQETGWGRYKTYFTLLFNDVDKTIHVKANYDEEVCKYLNEEIAKTEFTPPKIIFIQLLGSHEPFENRYPSSFNKFSSTEEIDDIQKLINNYDNSILYTDYVLKKILETMKKIKKPAFLLYFSDHGEAVNPNVDYFIMRDKNQKECYEIPFFLWLSPEYKKIRPDFVKNVQNNLSSRHQTDRLIYGMLDLMGISYKNFPYDEDIFSSEYKEWKRFSHDGLFEWSEK